MRRKHETFFSKTMDTHKHIHRAGYWLALQVQMVIMTIILNSWSDWSRWATVNKNQVQILKHNLWVLVDRVEAFSDVTKFVEPLCLFESGYDVIKFRHWEDKKQISVSIFLMSHDFHSHLGQRLRNSLMQVGEKGCRGCSEKVEWRTPSLLRGFSYTPRRDLTQWNGGIKNPPLTKRKSQQEIPEVP